MNLYIENHNEFTKKVLELMNKFSKVAECRINTQKSIVFLYTNSEQSENGIKKAIPLIMALKE